MIDLDKQEIIQLLKATGDERTVLLKRAQEVKVKETGNKVYFRGLVEFSNICAKDCLYCGIRKGNDKVIRYDVSDDEILESCRFAWENCFASVVLQSGELSSPAFVKRVDALLKKIKQVSNGELELH